MTSTWSQLEQMLTCAICLDKFKNPRLLPCQHSFCGDACMEGLVDYARRQIKCPECRAEHRIPYQGVTSLPSNVTLIRFLELHSRITGDEPDPVPKFMEKCSVCGEKVDGVQRCCHCDKKVCPECKEAHLDLLKREINRVNGQIKRCLSKIKEFKDSIKKCQDKLTVNHVSVRHEIEESSRRLIEDLKAKQEKLLNEVDSYAAQENKLLNKLDTSLDTELNLLESNVKLCDDNINAPHYNWTDLELVEMKEIYVKALEFVRLFDPDLGDFTRKMRFQMIPEFDTMRKKICELGEMKFADTSATLLVASLQFCGATGPSALELSMAQGPQTNYSLAHSSSNSSQMNALSTSATAMLQLPSMQNSLMRSQSDHRLAQQFQQRLKQQEQSGASGITNGAYGSDHSSVTGRTGYSSRYGTSAAQGLSANDTFEQSMRSRYGPGARSAANQTDRDLERLQLTRDWPRPSDNVAGGDLGGGSDLPLSSSIHFKSAFMRRKEKERQQQSAYNGGGGGGGAYDDDDDNDSTITSASAYKVRFNQGDNDYAPGNQLGQSTGQNGKSGGATKVFDLEEVERGPYSGVIRLCESPYLLERLHQLEARSKVEKKAEEAEAELRSSSTQPTAIRGSSNVDNINVSSRTPINYSRQLSEDEIEKQKKANKLAAAAQATATTTITASATTTPTPTDTTTATTTTNNNNDSLTSEPRPTPRLRSRANQLASGQSNDASESSLASDTSGQLRNFGAGGSIAANAAANNNNIADTDTANSGNTTPTPAAAPKGPASMMTARQVSDMDNNNGAAVSSGGSSGTSSSTRQRKNLRSLGRSTSSSKDQPQAATGAMSPVASAAATRQRRRLRMQESSRSQDQSLDGGDTPTGLDSTGVSGLRSALGTSVATSSSLIGGATGSDRATSYKQQQSSTSSSRDISDKNSKNYLAGSGGSTRYSQNNKQQRRTASNDRSSSDHTTTTTDDDDNDIKISDNDCSSLRSRSRTMTATPTPKTIKSSSGSKKETDDDSDDDDDDDDDDDLSIGSASMRGIRKSRDILPNAVSLLLDRSAQIRKDSLEQRNRADSPGPQSGSADNSVTTTAGISGASRVIGSKTTTTASSSTSGTSSPLSTTGGGRGGGGGGSGSAVSKAGADSNGSSYRSAMSSSSSTPMTARQRLAYKRSITQSIHSSQDNNNNQDSSILTPSNNSATSVYSTASSGGGHRSSFDSTDGGSTLNKTLASSSIPYQSRFLARSRTSAALAQPTTIASNRSQFDSNNNNSSLDNGDGSSDRDYSITSNRSTSSYLSGRDRGSKITPQPYRSTTSTGPSTSKRSPQIEQIDDMSPFEGMKTHSEYLRNKFSASRRASGSGSSSSAALLRSRSTHAMFGRSNSDSNSDTPAGISDVEDNDVMSISSITGQNQSYLSKRGSFGTGNVIGSTFSGGGGLLASSSIGQSDSPPTQPSERCVYTHKKRMLFRLGSRGSDPGHLTWPRGVAVTGNDQIVVADSSNHRVQLFDVGGRFLSQFGSYGSAPGEFDCLAGIAVNRIRQYIVSDRYNHRIQVFDPSGRFMRAFGTVGRSDGKFNLPWGVACDSSGLIYVCDKENHRVQVFDVNGSHINKFGQCGNGPGQLQHPHYIALGQGKVVVTDTNNHRVQIFDLGGRLITLFGQEGSANGQFKFPRGVAMDDQGYIIVGDSGNNRLQIFNSEGVFVKSLGTWGSAEGEFKGIEGVAVNSSYNILVCDRENHRIQVF